MCYEDSAIIKLLKKLFKREPLPPATIIPRSEHSISRANINPNAIKVLYTLKDAGYSAYLVGGGVRDLLVAAKNLSTLPPKDFDVVTNAHPEQIKPLFRRCLLIGRRFRLAHVYFGREMVEVATFRAQQAKRKQLHSKHGMLLRDNVYGTLVEDVWRRDFTINALYYNIQDFSIVDYCGGITDLNHKIVRMIGDPTQRYQEDPVRLLRAVRIAAKLEFQIESATEAPIRTLAPLLQQVPPARLFEEVLKLFHSGKAFHTLELLRHYDLFPQLFPQTVQSLQQPHAEALLKLACQTTDKRINSGKHVSAAFLFASLLWHPLQNLLQEFITQGHQPAEAFFIAAHKVFALQIKTISIPKRFSIAAKEIWGLQSRLQNCYLKQIPRLLNHPRLRAAYDFLVLRAATGEAVSNAANWWTKFLEANEQEKQQLLAALPKQPQKRRRKRVPYAQ